MNDSILFSIFKISGCTQNKRIKFHSFSELTLIFQKPIHIFLQALVTAQYFPSLPDLKTLKSSSSFNPYMPQCIIFTEARDHFLKHTHKELLSTFQQLMVLRINLNSLTRPSGFSIISILFPLQS